jgi:predicted nuclease of predicted toxin-antitoxin system
MLRILLDENFNQRILRGIERLVPGLDYVIVQESELERSSDPVLLAWAAEHQRVIITHDINTVTKYANDRLRAGEPMAGVIIVPEDMAIGMAVEELAILIACSEPEEVESQVKYVPI